MSGKEFEYRVPDYPNQEKGFIFDEEKFGKFSKDIFNVPIYAILCAIYLNYFYIYSIRISMQLTSFIINFFINILLLEIILRKCFTIKNEE